MTPRNSILALPSPAPWCVVGCASLPSSTELDTLTQQIVKNDFHDKGIVKVSQAFADDETMRLCNAADVAGKPLDDATAKRIEALNMKTIKWPADGKYLGDWKEGEKWPRAAAA
jgi:sulfur-oxidizing protein SoxX